VTQSQLTHTHARAAQNATVTTRKTFIFAIIRSDSNAVVLYLKARQPSDLSGHASRRSIHARHLSTFPMMSANIDACPMSLPHPKERKSKGTLLPLAARYLRGPPTNSLGLGNKASSCHFHRGSCTSTRPLLDEPRLLLPSGVRSPLAEGGARV